MPAAMRERLSSLSFMHLRSVQLLRMPLAAFVAIVPVTLFALTAFVPMAQLGKTGSGSDAAPVVHPGCSFGSAPATSTGKLTAVGPHQLVVDVGPCELRLYLGLDSRLPSRLAPDDEVIVEHGSGVVAGTRLVARVERAAPSDQTEVDAGFNLFSPQQDVQLGRDTAQQVERDLPILDDGSIEGFLSSLGRRLAANAPGPDFSYSFKVINASDVNAFALPGGFVYLNRGLIEAAGSEGQLAGVTAHEIAHVALRHSTEQLTDSYLASAGLGVLGSLLGGTAGDVAQAAGGLGLNLLFLEFSRDDEEDADILGAQIMAHAGYDPAEMVAMFERMQRAIGGEGDDEEESFFSSHPPYGQRKASVRQEAGHLMVRQVRPVGGFERVRSKLLSMSPAPSMKDVLQTRR